MKTPVTIAVHARELEAQRIDGTRIYMAAILREWLQDDPSLCERVILCHSEKDFNPTLGVSPLYQQKKLSHWPLWTQTAFAWGVYRQAPDVLWMPLHNMPVVHLPRTRIVATIHDLAFKKFPAYFPPKDRRLHDLQTDYVVRHADHLIAVSHSTKRDIISHYPFVDQQKITVIHHGIDVSDWSRVDPSISKEMLRAFKIEKPYIVYVGALQPRKNLVRLVSAFEKLRDRGCICSLVLAGADAWLAGDIHNAVEQSAYSNDIILTGGISEEQKKVLLQNAVLMAYPSFYEGFGLPILEAFASEVPVVCADNSALREIARDSAQYCDADDVESITYALQNVFFSASLQEELVASGAQRLKDFSWRKAARKTLEVLQG